MVFSGDPSDIDPNSATAQLFNGASPAVRQATSHQDANSDTPDRKARASGEQHEVLPSKTDACSQQELDSSSTHLTDIFNAFSPFANTFNKDFHPAFPSAVPSPLHQMPTQRVQSSSMSMIAGPRTPALPPKDLNLSQHFYMTNEHLDVVGKTTWDSIETSRKATLGAVKMMNDKFSESINSVEEQLKGHSEETAEHMKALHEAVKQSGGESASHRNTIHAQLDQTITNAKNEVMGALQEQNKKTARMETELEELKQMVQGMQKVLETKIPESMTSQSQNSSMTTPDDNMLIPGSYTDHRSHPSVVGYYGGGGETGREGMPLQEHRTPQSLPPWNSRTGYASRNNQNDRGQYTSSNPYNNYGGEGQYNGYVGGFSSYGFSSPAGTSYAFPNGHANK